jgi:hypothetical protein
LRIENRLLHEMRRQKQFGVSLLSGTEEVEEGLILILSAPWWWNPLVSSDALSPTDSLIEHI